MRLHLICEVAKQIRLVIGKTAAEGMATRRRITASNVPSSSCPMAFAIASCRVEVTASIAFSMSVYACHQSSQQLRRGGREGDAALQFGDLDSLVRLVRVADVAGADDEGRRAVQLEDAGLGAIET